jgi:protein-tyrosine phosphatase
MEATLDLVDAALARGIAYVHCWGGCGRTGTVLACHLVRHGVAHADALERVSRATQTIGWPPCTCPQTADQLALVRAWSPGR